MSFRSEPDPGAKYDAGYLSDVCINHTDWYVWYG